MHLLDQDILLYVEQVELILQLDVERLLDLDVELDTWMCGAGGATPGPGPGRGDLNNR